MAGVVGYAAAPQWGCGWARRVGGARGSAPAKTNYCFFRTKQKNSKKKSFFLGKLNKKNAKKKNMYNVYTFFFKELDTWQMEFIISLRNLTIDKTLPQWNKIFIEKLNITNEERNLETYLIEEHMPKN